MIPAPSNSASQTEREAAGRAGTMPGKVHVLPGAALASDDGAKPVETPAAPAPTGWDVAKVALAAGMCGVIAVPVAATYSPVLAGLVAAAFAVPVVLESRRRWRKRRR